MGGTNTQTDVFSAKAPMVTLELAARRWYVTALRQMDRALAGEGAAIPDADALTQSALRIFGLEADEHCKTSGPLIYTQKSRIIPLGVLLVAAWGDTVAIEAAQGVNPNIYGRVALLLPFGETCEQLRARIESAITETQGILWPPPVA